MRHALPAKPVGSEMPTFRETQRASATSMRPSLPYPWQERVSSSTKTTYYYNPNTGESSWTRPTSSHGDSNPQDPPRKRSGYDSVDSYIPGSDSGPPARRPRRDNSRRRDEIDRDTSDNGDSWVAPSFRPPPPPPLARSGSTRTSQRVADVYIPNKPPSPQTHRARSPRMDLAQNGTSPSMNLDLRDDEDDVPTELLEPKPSTDSTTGFDLSEAKAKLADKAQQLQIQIQHQQEVVTKPTTTSPIEPRKDRKSRFGDKDASSARSGSEAVTETTNRMDTDEDGGGTGSQVSAPQLHEEGHYEDREEPGPARSPSPSQDEHWHSPPQEPRHSPPALRRAPLPPQSEQFRVQRRPASNTPSMPRRERDRRRRLSLEGTGPPPNAPSGPRERSPDRRREYSPPPSIAGSAPIHHSAHSTSPVAHAPAVVPGAWGKRGPLPPSNESMWDARRQPGGGRRGGRRDMGGVNAIPLGPVKAQGIAAPPDDRSGERADGISGPNSRGYDSYRPGQTGPEPPRRRRSRTPPPLGPPGRYMNGSGAGPGNGNGNGNGMYMNDRRSRSRTRSRSRSPPPRRNGSGYDDFRRRTPTPPPQQQSFPPRGGRRSRSPPPRGFQNGPPPYNGRPPMHMHEKPKPTPVMPLPNSLPPRPPPQPSLLERMSSSGGLSVGGEKRDRPGDGDEEVAFGGREPKRRRRGGGAGGRRRGER
ncbi:hypothetical protein DL96DRAFT_1623617 [Flagelloscypha sp. PMI_526]|nr:hypothetical protein DL96DRAFT_1623617 [Flagelloscypha sp. PMI_526]